MGKASTKKPLKAKSAKSSAVRSVRPAARAAISTKKASAPVTTTKAIAKPVAKTTKPAIELKPKTPVIETKKAVAPAKGLTKPAPALAKAPAVTKAPVLSKAPALTKASATSSKSAPSKNHAPPVIVAAPVPTDGKPRKNQAGLGLRELEHFRELLLAKRRELLGDMSSMEREALRSAQGSNLSNLPIHMADMGTDNYEQEFTLGLVEKDRQLLREINSSLAKIQDGTYGLCEGTGKPISKARLEAQPWARYSIEYAREQEKRGIRR